MQQKNRRSEELARDILKECLPDRYGVLECKDAPDLHDSKNKIGVEVTMAYCEPSFRANSFFNKICGKKREDFTPGEKKELGRLKDEGFIFDEFYNLGVQALCHPALWGSNEYILKEVRKKIKKLNRENNSYADFNEYHLFIYADVLEETQVVSVCSDMKIKNCWLRRDIDELIEEIQEIQEKHTRRFSTLYFKDVNVLYDIDLSNGTIKKIYRLD